MTVPLYPFFFFFGIFVAPGTAPIISVEPSSLTVLEGEEASFQCSAIGDPKPTIRWSREKGQLPPSSTSLNGFLRIFPTKLEDGGDYVCTAANTIGVDGYLVTLTVERGKVITTRISL